LTQEKLLADSDELERARLLRELEDQEALENLRRERQALDDERAR